MNPKRSKSKDGRKMPIIHPNAAAIDVGATMHMAAVRADRAPEPVRSFGTFTADLHRLVDWFTECGVETVVMESTRMLTSAPSSCLASASWSRRSGMAVISLVFSGTESCAKVSLAVVA